MGHGFLKCKSQTKRVLNCNFRKTDHHHLYHFDLGKSPNSHYAVFVSILFKKNDYLVQSMQFVSKKMSF